MKSTNRFLLQLLVLFVLFSPLAAQANIMNDMIGRWTSNATIFSNGNKIGDAIGTSRISRFGKKGLYSVGTVRVGNLPAGTTHMWMHDNGTLLGYVKQSSRTIGIVTGTWSSNRTTLVQNAEVHNLDQDYSQTVLSTWVNKNRLKADSSTSNGLRLIGFSTRK